MSCYATLKEKGLRLTQPRRVILDYIHDRGDHITADEIINYVHKSFPRINKSTIYRTLELLEKNDCVFKSETNDCTIYHHADEGHHHHLVCLNCGQTTDCPDDIFTPVQQLLKKKYGFDTDFKHIVINGICKNCR